MTALSDIQRLVECESPTEDLAACNQVIDTALDSVLHTRSTSGLPMVDDFFGIVCSDRTVHTDGVVVSLCTQFEF